MYKLIEKINKIAKDKGLELFYSIADERAKEPYAVLSIISATELIGIDSKSHTQNILAQIDIYTSSLKSALFWCESMLDALHELRPHSLSAQPAIKESSDEFRIIIEMEILL